MIWPSWVLGHDTSTWYQTWHENANLVEIINPYECASGSRRGLLAAAVPAVTRHWCTYTQVRHMRGYVVPGT